MSVRASRIAAEGLKVLPRRRLSRTLGQIANASANAQVVKQAVETFSRVYQVDLAEALVPDGGFKTFNDFFGRALRKGARPVASGADTVVCPADGRIVDQGVISAGLLLRVKGRFYSVSELLGGPDADIQVDPARFRGGSYSVIYLAPPDYHRVHAPVDGGVVGVRRVDGTLFPVNRIAEHIPSVLARNERAVVVQHASKGAANIAVATIFVGAMVVGSIVLDDSVSPGQALERGSELGAFQIGSTVVLLSEQPIRFQRNPGEAVKVGQALGDWTGLDRG